MKKHLQNTELIESLEKNLITQKQYERGISVILPVFNSSNLIEKCIQSIVNQEITNAKFELIIILNGVFSEDLEYLLRSSNLLSEIDYLILINDLGSASAARNLGMEKAKYSHVTFLDVDDYFSNDFLQTGYNLINEDEILISQIHDVNDVGILIDNPVNNQVLQNLDKRNLKVTDVGRIATITACKFIPKKFLENIKFKEHINSGEDTVFFTELFMKYNPPVNIVPFPNKCIYYRLIRENSISRKGITFEFLINDRLEILKILDNYLSLTKNLTIRSLILSKYNAQIIFMNKYLLSHPDDREKVLKLIENYNLKFFNYSLLNNNLAKTLYITYCFPPFSDTSATVVSKRILENNFIVDVVYNNMSSIRSKDETVFKIIEKLIGKQFINNKKASFSSMYYLSSFVDMAFTAFVNNIERYDSIYSRAMFPISHFPGLFIKSIKPNVKWSAEFSDPLLFDIESRVRKSTIDNDLIVDYLQSGILGKFTKYVDNNLFNLSEIIPFALADELIFTNFNQMEFMISRFSIDEQEEIRKKSIVKPHPSLDSAYYDKVQSNYPLNKSLTNLAYFGNFYSIRGIEEIISLQRRLNKHNSHKFKIHIFTNISNMSKECLDQLKDNFISVNNYVPYLEFLNLTTRFDALIITDTKTKSFKSINPYLPSKLADYLGSSTKILALCEQNSVLDNTVNPRIYKLYYEDFSNTTYLKERYREIADFFRHNRSFYVSNTIHGSEVIEPEYDIKTSKFLRINPTDDWGISIYDKAVNHENEYSFEVYNKESKITNIHINSYYRIPNIISLTFSSMLENEYTTLDYVDIYDGITIKLKPHEQIKFVISYDKEYKNLSFLNAGRLNLSIKE